MFGGCWPCVAAPPPPVGGPTAPVAPSTAGGPPGVMAVLLVEAPLVRWGGGQYSTTLMPTRELGPYDWASTVISDTSVSAE